MEATKSDTFDATYFEENYPAYDFQNPPRKLTHYARTIEAHAGPEIPRRIHDIGCAFGRFLDSLGSGWELFGSDVSQFAVENARKSCPRGRFEVADNADKPAFGEQFGVVTAFDVIEHVPRLDALGNSVHEQLLPGGLFVFVVPVYDGLSGPAIRRLDRDPTHIHKWHREDWLDWAKRRFDVIEWHGIVRYLLPGNFYLHRVTHLLRRHTPAILVVCRKRPD